ncbi:MAG: DUF1287 domain-containing protein [Flavobacterium sp.]|nr:MAG: DUF1287 domain-containing protein [Flavobacterium sp.]
MSRKILSFFVVLFVALQTYAQTPAALKLSDAALALTKQKVTYDPAYFSMPYPNGDVPADKGVCTDVVIRAYRNAFKIDLQKDVHEDMKPNFKLYPKDWGRKTTDRNIDHRRVYNLMVFFKRKGVVKSMTKDASQYKPGDIVCWNLSGNISHIGLVVNKKSADGKRYLIVHNIGAGQVMEDVLFAWKIIGHYTYKV